MKERILTEKCVHKLGLDKVAVITEDMLKGYTIIEDWAFYYCGSLTSITIPDSVKSIGDKTFYCCTALTSVRIPYNVTRIGDWAFFGCKGLTSITIPNSVKSIGDKAFYNCGSLTSITIPNSVTSIGYEAFRHCTSLVSVIIPNSVTSIDDWAFYGCSSLTSITIPDNVKSIGWNAFYGCTALTSISIPDSLKSIGESAFEGCESLTSATIGYKEYKRQEVVGGKCKAYKAFNGDMTCRGFQYEEGKTYWLDGDPELCKCGFHACLNLTDVFNYYYGKLGKKVVIHEVELEGVSEEHYDDTKVVAKTITIGKRIL